MKFLLDKDDCLKYYKTDISFENDSRIIDEDVLIYNYCQYESDIHLIYLQKDGALNYILFKDEKMSESVISKFDTRSNTYSQIYILIIKNKINIFYSYSNIINSNICTLHHVVIDSGKQSKHNIIRFVSKTRENQFVVHNDSGGNIHLLYNTVSDNYSYIFYTYFNPYKNQWLNNPIKISATETYNQYPKIFVDSKNFVHAAWWEKVSKGYHLKYKRMSSQGKDMYKWQEMNLPNITQDTPVSSIFEKDNNLFFKCMSVTIISTDNGNTWTKEKIPQDYITTSNSDNINNPEEEILETKDDLILDYEKLQIDIDEIKQLVKITMLENTSLKNSLEKVEKEIEELKQSKTGLKKFFFN